MKNSPLVWWLFILAVALLGLTWMLNQADPGSDMIRYAPLSGGLGSGILLVLGLTSHRWATGQRAFAQRSGKESSEKHTAARAASQRGCIGSIFALLWILMGLAALLYLLVTLR
jgi:hypothetical protein